MSHTGSEAIECYPLPARKFGVGDIIWQLDEFVEPREVYDSSPFLVPAMPDPGLPGCVWWRIAQELVGMPSEGVAGVGEYARRRRGGILVEHTGEVCRLSCGEGGQRHVQPCERVPGLPLLGVVQPEQCQRGSVGG